MEIVKTKQLTESQFRQIEQLWNTEYPIKLKGRFALLLKGVTGFTHYLIEDNKNVIIAWAVEFRQYNEIRFSVIVTEKEQGKGIGTLLINELKQDLGEFYGWVIDHNNDKKENGESYKSPLDFYIKHGFKVLKDKRIETPILRAVKIKRCIYYCR